MKKLFCFIALGIVFYSCEPAKSPVENQPNRDSVIIGTGHSQEEILAEIKDGDGQETSVPGPYACLTIVKFNHKGQENKVIVQNLFKSFNGTDGCFEYFEDSDLYLNILPKGREEADINSGVGAYLTDWMEQEMPLAGTTPYIPLADGYYLIDWKWHQLFPLSALATVRKNAHHDNFAEHIREHCFLTDIEWKDLNSLTTGIAKSNKTQHVNGMEIIRVDILVLDRYYHDVKIVDPYVCWNMSIYYDDGMCLENAYMYYKYEDCSHSGKTHRTYISYCDSLQSVYQQRLTELINNGQLKEIGY